MDEARTCSDCGKPLDAGAWGGICSNCLLSLGVRARGESTSVGGWMPPTVTDIAAHFPELEIQEILGRGGMGAVYKARQKSLNRLVALKILPPAMAAAAGFTERFSREAQAMAKLNHPHIVVIHDFGARDGLFFFIMEYVDGLNLRALMEGGGIKPEEALKIVPQICEALQYAHDHGVVHRDIKPENILLDRQGSIKITDFGLARLIDPKSVGAATASQTVLGTPVYMAPEQLEHPSRTDHRADIYSLGVVFYQLLTGELPLGRFPPPSRRVQIDVRLDDVVLRTLEKDPALRYQRAGEVQTDVQTIVATPGGPKMLEDRTEYSDWKKITARPMILVGGITAILAFCAIGLAAIIFMLKGGAIALPFLKLTIASQSSVPTPSHVTHTALTQLDGSPSFTRTRFGTVCLLPHVWRHAHALVTTGETLFIGGMGRTGAELARFDFKSGRWRDYSGLLPLYWHSVRRTVYGKGNLLLVGGSKPEPGGFGVKSRPVTGILNLTNYHFHDLTSQMRLADSDPYILGVGGAAYGSGRFLIGGAGGSTFLLAYTPGAKGGFTSLAGSVPYYFAANNVLALNSGFLMDGGGAGPGGEPGTPPALGLVSASGQFADLTGALPPGIGVMGCSAFDGETCLIQCFNTVDAHQMLELFNPFEKTFKQVTTLFPQFISVQAIAGDDGRFVVGGFYGPGAYLGLYRPAAGMVRNLTAELPPDARTAGTVVFDGKRIIVSGQTAQDRTFVAIIDSRAARGPAP